MLCSAERVTPWLHEDEDCWVAECLVCRTPMVVWRSHGLPGEDGYWIDPERRRIPDHWHAHARPAGGFFDPRSELFWTF